MNSIANTELSKSPTFIAIDFETANKNRNSAVSLAIVRVENWEIVSSKSWVIRPPDNDFCFTDIHGISWDDVKDCKDFSELWEEISQEFNDIAFVVAHNAEFDIDVLKCLLRHYNLDPPPIKSYRCTVHLARKIWNIYPTKLNMVCEKLAIPLDHHDATSDAEACAKIALAAWKPNDLYSKVSMSTDPPKNDMLDATPVR